MISLFMGESLGAAATLSADAPALTGDAAAAGPVARERWLEQRPAWTEESWWDVELAQEVRALLWLPAGPGLALALEELAEMQRCVLPHTRDRTLGHPAPGSAEGWPCACQVVVAAAWEACGSWVAAGAARALVRAVGAQPVEVPIGEGRRHIVDPAREQLAVSLRCSPAAMANRMACARALVAHPVLVGLVGEGAITFWAGRRVVEHLLDLDAGQASMVVEQVADRVRARLASGRRPYNSADVNRLTRRARLGVCPETVQEAQVRAFATRRVTVTPQRDGMATLVAELAETDAHRLHRRLTAIAAGLQVDAEAGAAAGLGQPDPRTRDQLRADVLVDLVLGQAGALPAPGDPAARATRDPAACPGGSDHGARAGGAAVNGGANGVGAPNPCQGCSAGGVSGPAPRPEITVVVSLPTLLGLRDDPAEVPGVGAVPAAVARELAADGDWRAWIVNAAGAVIATGSSGYTPSPALARLVRAREPYCRFPGCRQPAMRCDLDHAIPWPRGATAAENLGPLCRRHHGLKTHLGWELRPDPGGRHGPSPGAGGAVEPLAADAWRWRSPTGAVVTDGPEAPLP